MNRIIKNFWILSIPVLAMVIFVLACKGKKQDISQADNEHHHGPNTHTHEADEITSYFDAYDLSDENFGTHTKVSLTAAERIMVTNSLPNHNTGEFPNHGNPNTISAQNKTYTFPRNPKYTGVARWIREPGIAINGIKFEPGTAEVVVCESGENYRVEAFQDIINLGLDFNHAHVQPTGAYHYHGSPTSVIKSDASAADLIHIGFAHDGFPMYYSKSGKYKPSYKLVDGNRNGDDCSYENPMEKIDVAISGHHDGTFTTDFEFVDGSGDLDACNGITIAGQYMYLVTEEFPYVSRCLMGEFENQERHGPPNGKGSNDKPGGRQQGKLNEDELIKLMDSNQDGKLSEDEVKGPLKQDFTRIDANKDGFVSKEEIIKGRKLN